MRLSDWRRNSRDSTSLAQVNAMLREQLDQANSANQALSEDLRKLTADWTKAREELEQRESEWRREEESFNSYFSNEHSRLLSLWRQVVSLRRLFSEMKSMTERDLSQLHKELSQSCRSLHASCLNVSGSQRMAESTGVVQAERQALQLAQLEEQLKDKVRQMIQLQAAYDAEKAELNAKVTELNKTAERLQDESRESERQRLQEQEQSRSEEQAALLGEEVDALKCEKEVLQEALRELTQAVLSDSDSGLQLSGSDRTSDPTESEGLGFSLRGGLSSSLRTSSPLRRSSPHRSSSPRRSLSPAFRESAVSAVHSALQRRQLQLQVGLSV
eukprot:XP_002942031.3 PREDICTED: rootletin-like [Xenopus tropicalis]